MKDFPSDERVNQMAAQVRAVKPKPAPLDTPLPEHPRVLVVENESLRSEKETSHYERAVRMLKYWKCELIILDLRLADEEASTASCQRLASSVQEYQPDILFYFNGHCNYVESKCYASENHKPEAAAISKMFRKDRTSLQLVFLGCCHAGKSTSKASWPSLPKMFVELGAAAVISMQICLDDLLWLLLFETFCSALAKGKTVRSAAYAARKAVQNEDDGCEPLALFENTAFGCRKAAFPRKRDMGL